MVSWHSIENTEGMSRFHRREILDQFRADAIRESLSILQLTGEMYHAFKNLAHFSEIVGLALSDPEHPMSFFGAEYEFFAALEKEQMQQRDFNLEFHQNSFADERELYRLMLDL